MSQRVYRELKTIIMYAPEKKNHYYNQEKLRIPDHMSTSN